MSGQSFPRPGSGRFRGVWLVLALAIGLALVAIGLAEEFGSAEPTSMVTTPRPGHTVETAPGTATDGHFTIRLIGGTAK